MVAFDWSDPDLDWLRTSGRWQLLLIAVGYLIVVQVTNLAFVNRPAVLKARKELDEEQSELALCKGSTAEMERLVAEGRKTIHKWSNLSKVITARRYLHVSQRLRAREDRDNHVANARLASQRLKDQGPSWPEPRRSEALGVRIQINHVLERLNSTLHADARPVDNEPPAVVSARMELALLTTEALKLWLDNDDETLERNAEAQRRTLWMVNVGVPVIIVLGVYGPRVPLLFGAFGGFLAPVIRARRNRLDPSDYRTSWEILMLGPVAGALSAYAGLLLMQFLADDDIGLLGSVFAGHFDHPHTSTAKALAVLLGYSATLFAFLAGKAATAVETAPTGDTPSGQQTTTGPAAAGGGTGAPPTPTITVTTPATGEPIPAVVLTDVPPTVGESPVPAPPPAAPDAPAGADPLGAATGDADRLALEKPLLVPTDNGPRPQDGEQPAELED
jgi:hypothetical protein